MKRMTAPERLQRLLSVLPWVAGVGGASLDEIAERFDYPRSRLERDLIDVVQFVGVYPYTPGDLIEVFIDPETERVTINYADYFRQALRLTPEQALALVGSGAGLISASGDEDGPLARGIAKLADQLGIAVGDQVDVQLGTGSPATLSLMRSAVEGNQLVEIDYFSHGRNSRSHRQIEPSRIVAADGSWYVHAWCRKAEGERVFRLDRIHEATSTGETFAAREATDGALFSPSPDDPRITIDLDESAAWVASYYPVESAEPIRDGDGQETGGVQVVLAVTAQPWIERVLLQLGPHAVVIAADDQLGTAVGANAAARVLERYQS